MLKVKLRGTDITATWRYEEGWTSDLAVMASALNFMMPESFFTSDAWKVGGLERIALMRAQALADVELLELERPALPVEQLGVDF